MAEKVDTAMYKLKPSSYDGRLSPDEKQLSFMGIVLNLRNNYVQLFAKHMQFEDIWSSSTADPEEQIYYGGKGPAQFLESHITSILQKLPFKERNLPPRFMSRRQLFELCREILRMIKEMGFEAVTPEAIAADSKVKQIFH